MEFLDLTPQRDFSQFLGALHELYNQIEEEEERRND